MEGTVSQIVGLCPSFDFISKMGKLLTIFFNVIF